MLGAFWFDWRWWGWGSFVLLYCVIWDGSHLPAARSLISCYTVFVEKNITIRISAEAALWARRKAAEENTSVSRLVGQMLEKQMRESDSYREAYERFKTYRPSARLGAAQRLTREEVHERR